jgi:8-oxo-dGTP pyrophosphatase MutT (NUDIX family)
MGQSEYVKGIREKIGNDLLLAPGVAAIIRDEHGRILVQKNRQAVWNLPAGAIDPGEKPAQAIVREVFEETGLLIRPVRIIAVVGGAPEQRMTYDNGDQLESTTVVFACEIITGNIEPQDDETAKLKFCEPDQMPKLAADYPQLIFTEPSLTGHFEWKDEWVKKAYG